MEMKFHCCTLPKFKDVTHVIFDLDGTLLDTESVFNESFKQIAAEYGKEFTPEIRAKVCGTVAQKSAETAIKELGLELTVEEFLLKFREYSYCKISDCPLMPGADNLVRHLHKRGIPIAIATSSSSEEIELKCKNQREFFDLFHHIVSAESDPEVEWGKPNPAVFLVCASRFEKKPHPEKCLVFEDSPNGVKAGIAAGMQVIMIPEETVSYDDWKLATLRLDSMECMIPELFGLPAFKKEGEEDEEEEDESTKEIEEMTPG